MTHEIDFFFDPVCPFCWMTSKWVRQVQDLEDLAVGWRLISLAILNEETDDSLSTEHALGLGFLRVADAVADHAGNEGVGRYYSALGNRLWETAPDGLTTPPAREERRTVIREHHQTVADDLEDVLYAIGLPGELAEGASDETRDDVLRKSTELAMERTGGNVGTPILTFDPPDGPSFFGPVISRLAGDEEAIELWEAVSTLARWPTFAEIKRSQRDSPDTRLLNAITAG